MNNLKRVLSLALASVMLIGMMVVGASATDFTDAEEIQHQEAVDILVALDIINGKEDGSYFAPTDNVTRGEMAKMIAVAMKGGNDVDTGVKGTPSFTDIGGHWAESYIEYCYDLGIISGRGDGTFDPNANVTGTEATKMVLTALGYDSEAYKLKGATWATRTDELARTASPSLYEELSGVVLNVPATRDTAAQLIWNGLQNRTRKVTPSTNTNTGEVTWTYNQGNTMLKERYDGNIFTATFDGSYAMGTAGTEKGDIHVSGATYTYTDEDGVVHTVTPTAHFPSDLDVSFMGEEVKVIWKDGTRGTSGKPDKNDTIYGVFVTGKSNVVRSTLGDVKNNKNDKEQINVGGTKYDLAPIVTVIYNYDEDNAVQYKKVNGSGALGTIGVNDDEDTKADEAANSALTTALKKDNGDVLKLVANPDSNKIETIYVTQSIVAAVTAKNSTKITLNNGVGSLVIADNDIEEDLVKGDVVTVTTLYKPKATDDDAYNIVKKAEKVSGTVGGYKDQENVKVDGTTYKIKDKSALLNFSPEEGERIASFDVNLTTSNNTYINKEVDLYMVNGYVGAAVLTSKDANNYSVITEISDSADSAGSTFKGLKLQVMDATGTKTILTVSDESDDKKTRDPNNPEKINAADYSVGDIITYTLNKSGEAEVTVESQVTTDQAEYDDTTKTFGVANNTLTVTTTDAVIFVQINDAARNGNDITSDPDDSSKNQQQLADPKFKAYSIRDLKSFGIKDGAATALPGYTVVTNKDGKVVAGFANLGGDKNPSGATANTVYGIVSKASGRVKDYYEYTVQANGETYELKSKNASIAKGDLVYFDVSVDGEYGKDDITVVTTNLSNADVDYVKAVYTYELDGKDALTFYNSVSKVGNAYKGGNQETLALDKDYQIVYVDVDNNESKSESSIQEFDSVTGYKNAVILVSEDTDGKDKIIAIYVETSNEADILDTPVVSIANAAAGLTGDEIAGLADGVYALPKKAVGAGKLIYDAGEDGTKVRLFKFVPTANKDYTLRIWDDAGKIVFEDHYGSNLTIGSTYYYYMSIDPLACGDNTGFKTADSTHSAAWKNACDAGKAAPAGDYTYVIVNDADAEDIAVSGSFSL